MKEFVLITTSRLPTLIHTRPANSKCLGELSDTNPVWIHTEDPERLAIETGDLLRVTAWIWVSLLLVRRSGLSEGQNLAP